MKRFIWWLFRKQFRRVWSEGYSAGVGKGYELGYTMGQVEKRNRQFIMSQADREIDQILKEKGAK